MKKKDHKKKLILHMKILPYKSKNWVKCGPIRPPARRYWGKQGIPTKPKLEYLPILLLVPSPHFRFTIR